MSTYFAIRPGMVATIPCGGADQGPDRGRVETWIWTPIWLSGVQRTRRRGRPHKAAHPPRLLDLLRFTGKDSERRT